MIVRVKLVLVATELVSLISAGRRHSNFLGNTHLDLSLLPVLKIILSDVTISGPKWLSYPEMLNWIGGWSKWDMPSKDQRRKKKNSVIHTTVSYIKPFPRWVIQGRKNSKTYVTGVGSTNLNETCVCGSNLHSIWLHTVNDKFPRS